jgi:uncharacterized membrane protein
MVVRQGVFVKGLSIRVEQSASFTYISGTLKLLIGADLLRIKDISRLATSYASIGGAGTLGIFFTGIVAALLA